jgi:5,10-methylenetetrahydromethanopterin reductase
VARPSAEISHSLPLGVLLNAEYPAQELIRLGVLAEQLGYSSFWYTDVRMLRECYIGLAIVAVHTKRIRLATGVTDPYSRHPAITAASIATLDELSDGRAMLGLGLGGAGFRELGLARTLPVAAMRESIEVIRGLLRGEQVSLAGKVISLDQGRLQFPSRAGVPIYIATQGAQISRLAGALADGVLIANIVSPAALDFYLGQIADGAERAGRGLGDLDIHLRWEICISEDEAAALQTMRLRLAARLIAGYPRWDFLGPLGVQLPDAFTEIAQRKDMRQAAAAAELLPMEVVDASMVAGSPARVAARIAPMLRPEVSGVTIRPHACTGTGTGIDNVMRVFVQDVMPRLGWRQAEVDRTQAAMTC